MKKKSLISILTAMLMVFVCLGMLNGKNVFAADAYFVPVNATGTYDAVLEPGKAVHVSIPVKPKDFLGTIYSLSASADTDEVKISNVRLTYAEMSGDSNTAVDISTANTYNIEFDATSSDTLKIGYNNIYITASAYIYELESGEWFNRSSLPLYTVTTYTATELSPADIIVNNISYDEAKVVPEQSLTMKVKVKNAGETQALNVYMTMDFGTSGIVPDYKVEKIKVGNLAAGAEKELEVPVKVLKNAVPGFYEISAYFTAKDMQGKELPGFSQKLYVTVNEKKNGSDSDKGTPVIELSTKDNYKELTPDTEDTISVTVKNTGAKPAKNIKLAVKSGLDTSIGLTKAYTSAFVDGGSLDAGAEKTVNIPIRVAKNFAAGLYELEIEAEYTDADGKDCTPVQMTVYVKKITDEKGEDPTKINNNVTISGVTQSPSNPVAGGNVTVTFNITNDGNAAVTNVLVYGTGLSSAGFEPLTSEPYQKVGSISANSSKKVTMSFKVGKNIPEGFNSLNIGYAYTDADNVTTDGSATVYILNVVNDNTSGEKVTSRPKLIISNSSTDKETLKAGDVFDFTFDLKNTHTTKTAKNIKVTLTQAEGVFAPTKGSNIIYIDAIKAGETVTSTMNLKTRGDIITGDYGLNIQVEYEYDDMNETDQEKGGVSDENIIKLYALENYRPVIENVMIDAWNGISVGNPVDLSFEFYNMGKSTLGNVYVTVEGDFALANNSNMSYVGAVNGYSQEYVNPQIVALVGGEAVGTLVVHFEDSNGDEVTVSQEFTAYVEEGMMEGDFYGPEGEWGGDEYFGGEWEGEFGGEESADGEEGFTILGMNGILFIVIASVLFIVIVVVIIVIVKKKKASDDDEDDD